MLDGLRILVVPCFWRPDPFGTSSVMSVVRTCRALADRGNMVQLVIPTKLTAGKGTPGVVNWKYDMDEWGFGGNFVPLALEQVKDPYQYLGLTNEMMMRLSPFRGEVAPDVVVNYVPPISPNLKLAMSGFGGLGHVYCADIPILTIAEDVRTMDKFFVYRDAIEAIELAGLTVDTPAFLSKFEVDFWLAAIRKRYKPKYVLEMIERASVVGLPIDLDGVREAVSMATRTDDRPTVFYGGRMDFLGRRVADQADVVNSVYSMGKDVRFLITTQDSGFGVWDEHREKWERQPWFEIQHGQNSEQYLKFLASADVFFSWFTGEAGGVAYWEQLAAGLVGLFYDCKWARDLLPDDYPFFFETKDEATAMAMSVLMDVQKAKRALDDVGIQKWLDESFHPSSVASNVENACAGLVSRHNKKNASKFVVELAEKAGLFGEDEFDLDDACERMAAESEKGHPIGRGTRISIGYVRNMFLDRGFRDVGDAQRFLMKRSET